MAFDDLAIRLTFSVPGVIVRATGYGAAPTAQPAAAAPTLAAAAPRPATR